MPSTLSPPPCSHYTCPCPLVSLFFFLICSISPHTHTHTWTPTGLSIPSCVCPFSRHLWVLRIEEAEDLGPAFEKFVIWGDKANTQDRCNGMKQSMIKGHTLRFLQLNSSLTLKMTPAVNAREEIIRSLIVSDGMHSFFISLWLPENTSATLFEMSVSTLPY